MNLYLVIETWNGDGYTDSDAYLLDFNNIYKAHDFLLNKAKEYVANSSVYSINLNAEDNAVEFNLDEDSGMIKVLPYSNFFGVVLHPMINSFTLINSQDEWKENISFALSQKKELDVDEIESLENEDVNGLYLHSVCEGDMKFVSLNSLTNQFIDMNKHQLLNEVVELLKLDVDTNFEGNIAVDSYRSIIRRYDNINVNNAALI